MEVTDDTDMKWAVRSAAGIDLDVGWRDVAYCAIDVETTGLDLRRDSIVSLGSAGTDQHSWVWAALSGIARHVQVELRFGPF